MLKIYKMNYKLHTHYKNILADLYTPVSIYNKLRDHFSNALLLETADYHDRTDSRSFYLFGAYCWVRGKGEQL